MAKKFTVEVGKFTVARGRPNFQEPDVRIPLVQSTLIGRASGEEKLYCSGQDEAWPKRASYDGVKLIVPFFENSPTQKISRMHGELRFGPRVAEAVQSSADRFGFHYFHLSDRGQTALWLPVEPTVDGIIDTVQERGQTLSLLSGNSPSIDSYLLLGGEPTPDFDGLTKRFPYAFGSYYVKVRREL